MKTYSDQSKQDLIVLKDQLFNYLDTTFPSNKGLSEDILTLKVDLKILLGGMFTFCATKKDLDDNDPTLSLICIVCNYLWLFQTSYELGATPTVLLNKLNELERDLRTIREYMNNYERQ